MYFYIIWILLSFLVQLVFLFRIKCQLLYYCRWQQSNWRQVAGVSTNKILFTVMSRQSNIADQTCNKGSHFPFSFLPKAWKKQMCDIFLYQHAFLKLSISGHCSQECPVKELGHLVFIWMAFLTLQVIKVFTFFLSFHVFFYFQEPPARFLNQSVSLKNAHSSSN